MKRTRAAPRLAAVAAGAALAAAALVADGTTSPAAAATAGELPLVFVAPAAGEPVFGPAEVIVEGGSGITRVRLLLDGRPVGERTAPPWHFTVDFGQENRRRQLRALAEGPGSARRAAEFVLPAIHVDESVDLRLEQVYATVTRQGRRVLDLGRGDFTLLDDGVPQELVTFERGEVPVTAALLVDASVSMQGSRLAAAGAGVRAFAGRMAALDEAALLLFSDRLLQRSAFTADPSVLVRGVSGVGSVGGSAIHDTLYVALQLLGRRQGRRVAILLSDGVDVHSVLRARDVTRVASRSAALVYWLRLRVGTQGARYRSTWRDPAEHRAELEDLARLVEGTGGRVIEVERPNDITAAFGEVMAELREQYVLGYYATTHRGDGRWHPVEVRVPRGMRVNARAGYVDE